MVGTNLDQLKSSSLSRLRWCWVCYFARNCRGTPRQHRHNGNSEAGITTVVALFHAPSGFCSVRTTTRPSLVACRPRDRSLACAVMYAPSSSRWAGLSVCGHEAPGVTPGLVRHRHGISSASSSDGRASTSTTISACWSALSAPGFCEEATRGPRAASRVFMGKAGRQRGFAAQR